MRKIVVVAGVLTTILSAAQFDSNYLPSTVDIPECDIVLHKKAFDICYDRDGKIPRAVAYSTKKGLIDAKNLKRKGISFRPDYSLKTKWRSYSRDYSRTGFDRGHLAPNAVFDYSRSVQKETFLMSNVAPQKPVLNRRIWAKIERFERAQTRMFGKLSVLTGTCGTLGKIRNGVAVPKWWYKIIWYPSEAKRRPTSFLVPNTDRTMRWSSTKRFLVPVEKIESVCSIDIKEKGDES